METVKHTARPEQTGLGTEIVRGALFLAVNWRLVHIIVAAARTAYRYLCGRDSNRGSLPWLCEWVW